MAQPTRVRGLGPHSTLTTAARRTLTARLADVRRYEEQVGGEVTEEGVHDMRVASRRLRAALEAFGLEEEGDRVKKLQDALGRVRDVHVQVAWLSQQGRPKRRAANGKGSPPRVAALKDVLGRSLPDAEQQLQGALARWQERTVPRLTRAIDGLSLSGRLGGRKSRKALRAQLARVGKRMVPVAHSPEMESAHRLRIAVKKLRYRAELYLPAFPRALDGLQGALVPMQELLGALHDADVRLGLLEELASRGEPTERKTALALLAQVQEERRRLAEQTVRELARWDSEQLVRSLRRMFAS